ncbi:biotin operon repressor [Methylobacterium brachiatum]|jgi:biotin operon repressor|uniref:Biotin operon repressor n=2 Tax=Methylobacterium brachiatum TaxID=269660 RepID=A0AAJ1X0M4_9HYPH|nr:biotin operon repressor [Methylobacterium brachiatum]
MAGTRLNSGVKAFFPRRTSRENLGTGSEAGAEDGDETMQRITATLALLGLVTCTSAASAAEEWQQAIATGLGKPGTVMPGGVYRVGLPRTDLAVTLDGVRIKPALALGSWLAFTKTGDNEVMVMGDLVLTEDEVNPVMKRLVEGGVEITALHNHLLRASPSTLYMHVSGHGEPGKLSTTLMGALGASRTPFGGETAGGKPPATASTGPASAGEGPVPAKPTASDGALDLDTGAIDRALGHKGKVNGGVYAVSVPRSETPKDHGMFVPEAMGSAIAINFQPTGGGKAAITGDFVLIADEVNPVIKALRTNGIEVTALHNHMLDDEPRLFFMHFWANDDAGKLANGLREALDQVKVAKG